MAQFSGVRSRIKPELKKAGYSHIKVVPAKFNMTLGHLWGKVMQATRNLTSVDMPLLSDKYIERIFAVEANSVDSVLCANWDPEVKFYLGKFKNFAETESSLTIAEKRKWFVAYYKQITTRNPPKGLSSIHCFWINKDGKSVVKDVFNKKLLTEYQYQLQSI